eukprot:TRINITY_DN2231_c0_g1_i1.p1 TRINITY_DN2231_c0_g1~~TRINITY_DN2231_c0_g1_i1.p1  ORF type:complete len:710 (-),score=33.38 TRINITY_DN2231_c0_g1_i1:655-2784(-)
MSVVLDAIAIRGVRSFSPFADEASVSQFQTIRFFRPLTVILGQNGAGKTTIIECLRASITGSLPPDCRAGHSFIHDPHLSSELETSAHIRLQFKVSLPSPARYLVSRSFCVLRMRDKLRFSSQDGALQVCDSAGSVSSASHKNSELDQLVPDLIGIPAAVLDHVVLCHQEDANWPLSEPRVLKQRFDDLFAAADIVRLCSSLREAHREHSNAIRAIQNQLPQLRDAKDRALVLNIELASLQCRRSELHQQVESLQSCAERQRARLQTVETLWRDLESCNSAIATAEAVLASAEADMHTTVDVTGFSCEDEVALDARRKQLLRDAVWCREEIVKVEDEITAAEQRLSDATVASVSAGAQKMFQDLQMSQRMHMSTQLLHMIRESCARHKVGSPVVLSSDLKMLSSGVKSVHTALEAKYSEMRVCLFSSVEAITGVTTVGAGSENVESIARIDDRVDDISNPCTRLRHAVDTFEQHGLSAQAAATSLMAHWEALQQVTSTSSSPDMLAHTSPDASAEGSEAHKVEVVALSARVASLRNHKDDLVARSGTLEAEAEGVTRQVDFAKRRDRRDATRAELRALREKRNDLAERVSAAAGAPEDAVLTVLDRLRSDSAETEKQVAGTSGALSETERQIASRRGELASSTFAKIEERYGAAAIKLETLRAAVADLAAVITEVDHRVAQYHSSKLERLNEIIGDLWSAVYQGPPCCL